MLIADTTEHVEKGLRDLESTGETRTGPEAFPSLSSCVFPHLLPRLGGAPKLSWAPMGAVLCASNSMFP